MSQTTADTIWVVVASCLVFFMNLGFALVESGLCRAKNTANILAKNFVCFAIAAIAYWSIGYGFMFGTGEGALNNLLGLSTFAPDGTEAAPVAIPIMAFFFFQVCFASTSASIVSGAVAERIKYISYILFAFLMSILIYPVVGHWIWGGGWLASLGMHDYAGSTAVHSVGGWAALVGILMLGPRLGRYAPDGSPRAVPGHSLSLATIGTFVLWFGWFGFNAGSSLAADGSIARVAVTTAMGAAGGIAGGTAAAWFLLKKPDLSMTLNGCLAGLVAITAPCAVVTPGPALLIGIMAGALAVFAIPMWDKVKIDDPVGALSVHLVNGVFGTLAVGLFAHPSLRMGADGAQMSYGLLYGGGLGLLGVQALGVVAAGAYVVALSLACWFLVKKLVGMRVSADEELMGLDIGEMGAPAYGSDTLVGHVVETAAPAAPMPAPKLASESTAA